LTKAIGWAAVSEGRPVEACAAIHNRWRQAHTAKPNFAEHQVGGYQLVLEENIVYGKNVFCGLYTVQ